MPVRIWHRPRFGEDFARQVAWIEAHREAAWLDRFDRGFAKLERRLRRFPTVGPELKRDGRIVLRHAPFPDGLPYLVQYAHLAQGPVREIWLVRLFHFAQERTHLDLSDALW